MITWNTPAGSLNTAQSPNGILQEKFLVNIPLSVSSNIGTVTVSPWLVYNGRYTFKNRKPSVTEIPAMRSRFRPTFLSCCVSGCME